MNLSHFVNFSWMSDASAWIGLLTLIALEIVLGIDNIVFISILSGKLPKETQPKARKIGLLLAILPRLVLLLFLPFVLSMGRALLTLPVADPENKGGLLGLSLQDLIVLGGGLFLLTKSTREIHHNLEDPKPDEQNERNSVHAAASFVGILTQIMFLNIVFSLDSIITAIGMVPKEQIMVMMLAVIVSTGIMAFAVNVVSRFVDRHPTVKMLALSFLLLVGMALIAQGLHLEIPKGYIYFAMAFSVFVEALNQRVAKGKRSMSVPFRPVSTTRSTAG